MFVFIDTETTGLEEKDRICQLAYKTEDRADILD
jgi:DNA polymerase III epsilon subunit-like protein